ncbi:MAG: MmgE/PrpD family protein [Deltaproteobacteria bacterium]|nr:MAG: MmgE/PrpD family protein [Deltaproteobacteria bacterium]
MSLQSELLSHIAQMKYEDLPPSVIEATKKSVLDTLAVLIAGSTDEYASTLVEIAKGWGGREECTIAVYGGKVPAPTAALVNCTMARARDLDEVHYGGGGHLGANIVPSAFVMAEYSKMHKEKTINGKDLILAHAIAADLLCRIPKAYAPGTFRETGWCSETLGPFVVAALGAKLLGFDEAQIRDALGLAYARLCGNAQVYSEGAHTGMLQNGFAGEGGVLATVLADHGLKGPEEVLEGRFGLFPLYLRGEHSPELFLAEMGRRFEGANVSLKVYPVYAGGQAAVYACIELAKKHDIKADNIHEVTISSSRHMKDSFGTEKKRFPNKIPEAQFSLYYGPAVGLLQRKVWLADFSEQALMRPEVLEMCRRITVVADPEKDAAALIPPTDVEIKTNDGKRCSMHVGVVPGNPDSPLSWADIIQKLKDCVTWSAKPLPSQGIDKMSQMVQNLEKLDDVTVILDYLT